MRIALGIEYDGTAYRGWQAQKHSEKTVQAVVERALSFVAAHPVRVYCAGRTDAGVHATGQVIHFDTPAQREARSWVLGANANLPPDVSVAWARTVDDTFHARFSAQRRAYRYVILSRSTRPAILAHRVAWDYRPLDADRMASAAAYLCGEHDFSSYRALACQAKSPVRTVYRLDVRHSGPFLCLDIEANGFLHHMVRNIAGVLMAIGAGEREPRWAQEVLGARDRAAGGVTAPARGLYLTAVTYPEAFAIPHLCQSPLVW